MKKHILILTALLLSACAHPNQNTYNAADVGKPTVVEFGTVLQSRQVAITGENTGTGAMAGGASGALIGAGASGGGLWTLGGALIGAVGGAVAEQAINDRVGVEYTITLKNKKTITVVQNQDKNDTVFGPGSAVMVQTSGQYVRVLSAQNLPDAIKKPKSVHILKQKANPDYEQDDDDK